MVIRKVYITYSGQKAESGNNYQQMHVMQTSNIINMQACTTACFLAKIATNYQPVSYVVMCLVEVDIIILMVPTPQGETLKRKSTTAVP